MLHRHETYAVIERKNELLTCYLLTNKQIQDSLGTD